MIFYDLKNKEIIKILNYTKEHLFSVNMCFSPDSKTFIRCCFKYADKKIKIIIIIIFFYFLLFIG